jgi:glycine cleavage system transcriptional repressor
LDKKYLRIAIFCRNRAGIVQAITRRLTELGADLGPTSFSILGNGAEFSTVIAVDRDREIWEFDSAILVLPHLADAQVTVQEYVLGKGESPHNQADLLLTVRGVDQPGILADLTEFLYDHKVVMVRMTTDGGATETDNVFTARLIVWIEPDRLSGTVREIAAYADQNNLQIEPVLL